MGVIDFIVLDYLQGNYPVRSKKENQYVKGVGDIA